MDEKKAEEIIDKIMGELKKFHQLDEGMKLANLMYSKGINFVPVIVTSEEQRNKLLDEAVEQAKRLYMEQEGRKPGDPLN